MVGPLLILLDLQDTTSIAHNTTHAYSKLIVNLPRRPPPPLRFLPPPFPGWWAGFSVGFSTVWWMVLVCGLVSSSRTCPCCIATGTVGGQRQVGGPALFAVLAEPY